MCWLIVRFLHLDRGESRIVSLNKCDWERQVSVDWCGAGRYPCEERYEALQGRSNRAWHICDHLKRDQPNRERQQSTEVRIMATFMIGPASIRPRAGLMKAAMRRVR